ncbi:hypothetical protein ACHAPT_013139 [Fusarium lateritium]
MAPLNFDTSWIWHPDWTENASPSAGGFVDFRKTLSLDKVPSIPVKIYISADTRYKLYINSRTVAAGPVKGDQQLWFFDELDVQPYLKPGKNHVAIRVLRFYYSTPLATSFPRTPTGGLFVRHVPSDDALVQSINFETNESWETSIDLTTCLPKLKDDHFLHIFEDIKQEPYRRAQWVPAAPQKFLLDFGLSRPWRLSPRMIPYPRFERARIEAINNIRSSVPLESWEKVLVQRAERDSGEGVLLSAESSHHIELEFKHHTTANVEFRFLRPKSSGSELSITYSECYQDRPATSTGPRVKTDRCDSSKQLIGPSDSYVFGGPLHPSAATRRYEAEEMEEVYAPFHFRTFRFIALDIQVASGSHLVLLGVDVIKTNYPLQAVTEFNAPADMSWAKDLWTVSLRTLENCMHDCYEDCPFYEQLQYAMDTRSSALFTYYVSGDDRLARQAIIQLHNSFQPSIGLTSSRAPCHYLQIIPHFSLFWICMVADHHEYFGDEDFVSQFLPVSHAVLETFYRRIDAGTGLVRHVESSGEWHFVDWTEAWKPFGLPTAAERTGYLSFTSCLYAYTLRRLAGLMLAVGRDGLVSEYTSRADTLAQAVRHHCFDGQFFTDGLAKHAGPTDYSQHSQVWAILSGAAAPNANSIQLLTRSLAAVEDVGPEAEGKGIIFTPTSTAMSFYTLRALSMVGGGAYDAQFTRFWDPWRAQLSQNLTTWVEDSVTQRSDCHAWGSSPLYEFIAEVVGLTPAAPGWATVSFKPRLSLFRELDVKVPVGGHLGSRAVRVRWSTDEETTAVRVTLSLAKPDSPSDANIPMLVQLPDRDEEAITLQESIEFTVKRRDVTR